MAAAADALELIYARNAPQAACAAASHEFEHEEASRPKDNPICAVGGMGADAGHSSDAETDPQVDSVFSESEREALLWHQKQLQESR